MPWEKPSNQSGDAAIMGSNGLNVLVDGAPRTPDLAASVGPLGVMIFRDRSTLTKASEIIPVFGDEAAGDAAKAGRRPVR